VAHGTQDQLVPIDRARTSIELLEQAGAQVTYCEDEVGHKLSANACVRWKIIFPLQWERVGAALSLSKCEGKY